MLFLDFQETIFRMDQVCNNFLSQTFQIGIFQMPRPVCFCLNLLNSPDGFSGFLCVS